MATLIRFWKPWGVLSQFTDSAGRPTLADHIAVPGVYAAGRLDRDSEGLLLLTDSGALQARIAGPRFHTTKTYLTLVETPPDATALARLSAGVMLRDGEARALSARIVADPGLPARTPPPAPRPGRSTAWLELVLDEGRNRQVRRMLAAIGSPVLRLVRTRIGDWTLDGLTPGQFKTETLHAPVSPAPASARRQHGRRPATRSSDRRSRKAPSSRTRRGS
ncbi:MAG TPA: pseudouridine synthase [Pseudomonadales bacterium]|nr:pseudouridine synthase [Pseudomonadales bacterium]